MKMGKGAGAPERGGGTKRRGSEGGGERSAPASIPLLEPHSEHGSDRHEGREGARTTYTGMQRRLCLGPVGRQKIGRASRGTSSPRKWERRVDTRRRLTLTIPRTSR